MYQRHHKLHQETTLQKGYNSHYYATFGKYNSPNLLKIGTRHPPQIPTNNTHNLTTQKPERNEQYYTLNRLRNIGLYFL